MKRIIFISRDTIVFILLLFLFMGAKCTKVNAYDFVVNGIYYNVVSIEDLTCEIAPQYGHSSKYSGNFVVPSEVQYNGKTLKVVRIGNYAFAESSLTSVTIPNGITRIGEYAFYKCTKVTFISIPSTVTSLGDCSFSGCNQLESVSLPNSVKTIGTGLFSGCISLRQITIPNGITSIPQYTFSNCSSLINVSIPQGVTGIGEYAFRGCTKLNSINLSNTITRIDEYAFYGCTAMHTLTIPSSCKEIKNYAFNDCIIRKLVLEDSNETLKLGVSYWDSYYDNNNKMRSDYRDLFSHSEIDTLYWGRPIALETSRSENLYRDGYARGIFGNQIKKIVVGNQITDDNINNGYSRSLFYYTLLDDHYITSKYHNVTFGEGISTIPNLSYNAQLDSIFIVRTSPPSAQGFSNKTYMNCTLVVPQGCRATYESANVWKNFWNIIESGQNLVPATDISLNKTTLSFNAANQTATLTATVTPSNATNKNVTWTSSNTAVATVSNTGVVTSKANGSAVITAKTTDGTNLTATCKVTVSIVDIIDDSIITFADANVKALCVTNWDANSDGELSKDEAAAVTALGEVFRENSTITSFNELKYFTGLTVIDNNAFDGCIGLISISIPSTLKRIKTGAFNNCVSLGKVIIQDIAAWCGIIYDGTDSNGDFPLGRAQHLYSDDNTEITELVIPTGVTRIEPLAFRDAKFVTSVTIPSSVNYIGREAFRGMHSLTAISIPQGVTSLEPYLLQDCERLISVNIPESVTSIGEHVFRKCYAINRIIIPRSVTEIGSYAFRYCNSLTDVYCYAEDVPLTNSNAFDNTPTAIATLHVPNVSKYDYVNTTPWSNFGSIVAIGEDVPPEIIVISSANDFANFAERVNNGGETSLCATLTSDIDLTRISSTLEPIGNEYNPYRGTFDGQGHAITGFEYTAYSDFNGLFGFINNATIKNFSISGTLTSYGDWNGVVGRADGASVISGIHSLLTINVSDFKAHTGGVVGGSSNIQGSQHIVLVEGCEYSGTLKHSGEGDCQAGIIGYTYGGGVKNCIFNGTIIGESSNYGGILGYCKNVNFIGVQNCLSVGKVVTDAGCTTAAAIIGNWNGNATSKVKNNYYCLQGGSTATIAIGKNTSNCEAPHAVTKGQLASGEVCYALNGDQTKINWYQTLGVDVHPVLNCNHSQVFFDATTGNFSNEDPDGIEEIYGNEENEKSWYDLCGRRLNKPTKGINIIRYSDGTSKKVLVK